MGRPEPRGSVNGLSGQAGPLPLPRDYSGQQCSLARTLEIVGERWTPLIVRDAFFGVRRFGDFVAHLGIPRAVLAERLASLAGEGGSPERRARTATPSTC